MKTQKFNRKELYELVWKESLLALSKKYVISDVGLRKKCEKLGVPIPDVGYWAKVNAGKRVFVKKLPEVNHGEQETTLEVRDPDKPQNIQVQAAIIQIMQEIESDNRINLKVPEKLANPDYIVAKARDAIFKKDVWKKDDIIYSPSGVLDINVTAKNINRALCIMDTLIKACRMRGHEIIEKNRGICIQLKSENYEISCREKCDRIASTEKWTRSEFRPTGLLIIKIGGYQRREWMETSHKPIESKISRIIAYMELKDRELTEIRRKNEIAKKEREDFSNLNGRLEDLDSQIKNNLEILENFKKGDCPISNDKCPVAAELIERRSDILKNLKIEKKTLDNQLTALENPENKYKDLKEKITSIEKIVDELSSVEEKISTCKSEIQELSKKIAQKNLLDKNINELTKNIKDCEDSNKILEEKHDEYTRVKERLKDKEKIVTNIVKLKEELQKEVDEKSKLERKKKVKQKEVEKFKEINNLRNISELKNEEESIKTLESELPSIEIEIGKIKDTIEGIKKDFSKLLNPYDTDSELEEVLNQTVHASYRILFFQETLNFTLEELNNRKLQEIKEKCNQIWAEFKSSTGMDSISWDKKFIPIINIGGFERNIYQLSASEKALVYFSIRAALLAKLGPNYFIVADNLLSPFMRENQDVILSLLNDIINQTEIQQIIFTGYDISPEFKCKNKIKI